MSQYLRGSTLESWIALSLVPGLGDHSFRKLLEAFGSPEQILSASHASLSEVIGAKAAQAIRRDIPTDAVTKTLDWVEADARRAIITLADEDYPSQLLETADPPPLLYITGRRELLKAPSLAIVGSRNATPQGIANAEAFAKAVSEAGMCVVSGLALGIDAAAHRGGLQGDGGSTAVVGTGLDRVYPARNRELAHELALRGVLLSELPLGTPAIGNNFPRRNRIISGLSLGVLVVEAAIGSGSLITARLAAEQGREVFAVPGSIHSPVAKGCHRLIKEGAKLAESAQDIFEELRWQRSGLQPRSTDAGSTLTEHADSTLLASLGYDPEPIDVIVDRSGLSAEQVAAGLLRLELDGAVASLPGGRYQRIMGPR